MSAFLSSWSGSSPSLRRDGDADAGADHDLVAVEIEGRADRLDDARARAPSRRSAGPTADLHDGELVAAEARHRVGFAHAAAQALGDRLEQRVADGMAERIVDLLEAIEVEAKHREAFAAPARTALLQPLAE